MANTSLHIKRIQQELREFQQNPSDTFHAEPLKDDIHIWHFTIKGPTATEFEGGYYHGKIELPFEYPMKPPALYFLTPSGRYETNTKICLTITDYHPEHWNPGWTIKTMLKALISYFPEKEGTTSVGALEYSPEERKKLAQLSRKWICPTCGPIMEIIKERQGEEEKGGENETQDGKKDNKNQNPADEEVSVQEAEFGYKGNREEGTDGLREESRENKEEENEADQFSRHFEKKEREIEIEQKETKEDEQKGGYQYQRDERERSVIEVDLKTLESALLQHILYYEARQSITYQKNILNTERNEAANQEERKEAPKTGQLPNLDNAFEDVSFPRNEEKVEEKEEVQVDNTKEEEKKRIKKQITMIDLLIAVISIGIVVVIVTV